jgi:hypothetical protein
VIALTEKLRRDIHKAIGIVRAAGEVSVYLVSRNRGGLGLVWCGNDADLVGTYRYNRRLETAAAVSELIRGDVEAAVRELLKAPRMAA